MNPTIECKGCKDAPESDDWTKSGCGTCGGQKVVLVRNTCDGCRQNYWSRPGVYTTYVGKTWTSFDGVQLVQATRDRVVCAKCVEGSMGRGIKGSE